MTSISPRFRALLLGSAVLAVSLVILSARPKHSEAQSEGTPVRYAAGWNMVGAPSATELQGASGVQYSYGAAGAGYVPVAAGEMIGGRGVWAYFATASTELLGRTASDYSRIFVPANRYVLAGNPSATLTLPISNADDAEFYDPVQGAYQHVDSLKPGQGAWVLRFMAGFVYIGTPPTDGSTTGAASAQAELEANPTDRKSVNDAAAVGSELVQSRTYNAVQAETDNFRAAFEDGLRDQGASTLQELTPRQVQATQYARQLLSMAQEAVSAGDTGTADRDVNRAIQEGRAALADSTALTTGSPTATAIAGPLLAHYSAAHTPGTLAAYGSLLHAGFISFGLGTPPSDQLWSVATQTLAGTLPPPRTAAPPTAAVTIDTLGCTPVTLNVGDNIFCLPVIHGSITNATWTATNANPSNGTGLTFGTSFTAPGTQQITLQACAGSACVSKSQTVTVGGGAQVVATPSPTPVTTTTATTLNGAINVTEQDVGSCGYSVMPQTSGQIQVAYGAGASSPGQINAAGQLQGGGSGSRQVTCNGTTATIIWSVQYQGQFSGLMDQTGHLTMTGQVTGHAQVSYQNCSSQNSNHLPTTSSCPPVSQPSTWTYTVHVSGQIQTQIGSGSGTLVMDSGCSTSGTWSAHQ